MKIVVEVASTTTTLSIRYTKYIFTMVCAETPKNMTPIVASIEQQALNRANTIPTILLISNPRWYWEAVEVRTQRCFSIAAKFHTVLSLPVYRRFVRSLFKRKGESKLFLSQILF